jgi:hypothetical protein
VAALRFLDFELSFPWVREARPARELAGPVMPSAQPVVDRCVRHLDALLMMEPRASLDAFRTRPGTAALDEIMERFR